MQVVVPMGGQGQRFVDVGYTDPKPLIHVNYKPIIQYITEMFEETDEFIFICNETHLATTNIKEVLLELKPEATVLSIPDHKLGPVHTVSVAYDYIDNTKPVIVSYCDNPYLWNREQFNEHIKNLDGCILTHTGFHPHTLSPTKMAFVKEENGIVSEIQEKKCYTDNPMNEHASTGIYYFRSGAIMKDYFNEMVNKNINYKGEYYVTLVYNLLIRDGLKVGFFDTPYVTVFGTPDEVENFEAWATLIHGTQIKTEEDVLNCYRYWKKYHESAILPRNIR